jgi:hypothetical protein
MTALIFTLEDKSIVILSFADDCRLSGNQSSSNSRLPIRVLVVARRPIHWILPHDIGVMFIGRIVKVHLHRGRAQENIWSNTRRCVTPTPRFVIPVIIAMMTRAVVSAVFGIINVIIGRADLHVYAWRGNIHSHMDIIRPYRGSGQRPYNQRHNAQAGPGNFHY